MSIEQIIAVLVAAGLVLVLLALILTPVIGLVWALIERCRQKRREDFERRDN